MRIPKKTAVAVTMAIGFVGLAAVASAAPTITDTTPAPSSHTRDGRASEPCDWCHTVTVTDPTPPPAPADTTAPSTSISGIPATWSKTAVTFTLTATDAGSGVGTRYYKLGTGAQTPYSAPVAVSAAGTTVVSYWSVDNAGNTEAAKTATIRVDGIAPVTTSDAAATYAGPATIRLTATDAHSGIGTTSYRLDGGAQTVGTLVSVITPGAHTLEFFTTDKAGNAETPKTVAFSIAAPVEEPPVVVPPVIPTDTVPPVVIPTDTVPPVVIPTDTVPPVVIPTDTVPPVVVPPVVTPDPDGAIVLRRPEREGRNRWEIKGRLLGAPIASDDDDDDRDEPKRRGIRNAVVRLEFSADGVTFAPTEFTALTRRGGEFEFEVRNLQAGFYRVSTADGTVVSDSVRLASRSYRYERDDD